MTAIQKSSGIHRGFKTKTKSLETLISRSNYDLEKLRLKEARSRAKWTKGYEKFLKNTDTLVTLKIHGTAKEADLRSKVKGWRSESKILTEERDRVRRDMEAKAQEVHSLQIDLATLAEQENSETRTMDDIVTQVFGLNDTVVQASNEREDCLNRHVFPRLVTQDGKLLSQVTFDSIDGRRRIVAMVNTMTVIQGEQASAAKTLIEAFFQEFESEKIMDEKTKTLYDLTHQLLVERVNFKVGPGLYRFLAMELNEETSPYLARAQKLLRQSIRSEKTNSYIRIYRRESRAEKWLPVPQS